MTKAQYEEIKNDNIFIIINFKSEYSKGQLCIKRKLFELKQKKIYKLLKDCTFTLTYKEIDINE